MEHLQRQVLPGLLRLALGRRLPRVEGSMRVAGLRDMLSVRRDRYGVAYVDARNDDDAWFGLGFCQAQDRTFQLDLRLRMVRGTLSEVFGETTLGIDRLSRRIGFIDASRRHLPVLDAEVRGQIDAFVRGINAGLSTTPRAPEHVLLRCQACAWRPEDVLAMGKLLSFLLIGNWDVELSRLKVLQLDGTQALRDLDPTPYPADHVIVSPPGTAAGAAIDHLEEDVQRFLALWGSVPAQQRKLRFSYPVTWRHSNGCLFRFTVQANPADQGGGLVFNDWIPLDGETWDGLRELARDPSGPLTFAA